MQLKTISLGMAIKIGKNQQHLAYSEQQDSDKQEQEQLAPLSLDKLEKVVGGGCGCGGGRGRGRLDSSDPEIMRRTVTVVR